MAPDSRLPVRPRPAGPRLVAPPGAGRVPPPGVGTGVRCGEPFVPGNGVRPERGPPSRPSRLTHVRVEPGAKPFVDDLLLGRGFVRSRAAPSLRSIESQPSTQGFVSAGRAGTRRPPAPARTRASGGVVGGGRLSRSRPHHVRVSSVSRRRRVTSPALPFLPARGGPSALPCSASRPPRSRPWPSRCGVSRWRCRGGRWLGLAARGSRPRARPDTGGPSWPEAGEGRRRSRPVFSPFSLLFLSFFLFLCLRSRAGAIPARHPRRVSEEALVSGASFSFFSGQRG